MRINGIEINNETLYSAAETSAALGLTEHTLATYRSKGYGPKFFKIGRRCMYMGHDLTEFVEQCAIDPNDILASRGCV